MTGGDFWSGARRVLATVAPTLGSALGGPLGGWAGRALAEALGLGEADEEAMAAAVARAGPEELLALKKAELDFTARLKELDIEAERVAAADREGARRREIERRDPMPATIALSALAGFFGILAAMIFIAIPESAQMPLSVMLGSLGTLVTSIGAYYFGSSAGSARKNEMLDRYLRREAP